MGQYTFKEKFNALHRYRNGESDGLATNPELQLWQQLVELKQAVLDYDDCDSAAHSKKAFNTMIELAKSKT